MPRRAVAYARRPGRPRRGDRRSEGTGTRTVTTRPDRRRRRQDVPTLLGGSRPSPTAIGPRPRSRRRLRPCHRPGRGRCRAPLSARASWLISSSSAVSKSSLGTRHSSEGASMSLKLYFHPLSSFCQKVLVAFYENATPFEPHIVDLANETSRAEFKKIWPIGKFPVLRDDAKDETIPESSAIIEYLALHYPGKTELVPTDAELARQTRLRHRFYDLYVNMPMPKVVTDRLRPTGKNDPHGVAEAKTLLETAYAMIDQEMGTKTWAMGGAFSMADCAAG